MRNIFWRLDGKLAVPCKDEMEWAVTFETEDRRVAATRLVYPGPDTVISTVFLGCDHSFGGPPLIFETMEFIGSDTGECERYGTWDEAENGHWDMVLSRVQKVKPKLIIHEFGEPPRAFNARIEEAISK